jgi:hypothetical protein
MRVTLGRVEKQIANTSSRDVLVLLCNVGEYDTIGDFWSCPHVCRLLEVGFSQIRETEQPQDGIRETLKYA